MIQKIMTAITVLLLSFNLSFCQSLKINGLPDDSTYRQKMYGFISDWWKTPYKWGGVSGRGIDCSAFTRILFKEVYHVQLPRTSREQYKLGKLVKTDDLSTGDLLFFKNSRGIWHVGTYIYEGFFVHSSSHEGVHVSNISENYYAQRMFASKRILQFSDIYLK